MSQAPEQTNDQENTQILYKGEPEQPRRPRIYVDKTVLQQYRQLCREIAELEAEKEQLAAGHIGSSWQQGTRVSGGAQADPTAQYAQRLWRLSSLLAEKLNTLIEMREDIEQAIGGLLPEDRRLLRLFYLQGHTAEECAQQLQYSPRHFWRRHQRVMQKLAETQGVYTPALSAQDWFSPSPQPAVI